MFDVLSVYKKEIRLSGMQGADKFYYRGLPR
jgi:hypothetical protein